jgi:hypothetical protein
MAKLMTITSAMLVLVMVGHEYDCAVVFSGMIFIPLNENVCIDREVIGGRG